MLNISATQELSKRFVRQEAETAALIAANDAQLKQDRAVLEEQGSEIAMLKKQLARIAQLQDQAALPVALDVRAYAR